ncbi:GIY-YIG nuclease family protein [Puniceicoccales bacterium CK1056]|uniref:GIY-YIG nuclease family protein n=1 Tax=Oceanipulchritudo coccoides TaxID=2706888 RepID=A0A6B2LZI7_9BACT|nr:GIY-YIG nuclease family protein [Oceanipulchritudo coccoides]NDV61459.1 GIY-YIG nuclease family protein [Oceanipulchritudo coccoides]
MKWSVYIVRCADNSLYTGVAIDVERRFTEHQSQGPKAAKYVRGRAPLKLVYTQALGTRSEAMAEEWRIKQLSKLDKEKLIRRQIN